jgi:glycosyltransferase involved in cell wall biosynthesis
MIAGITRVRNEALIIQDTVEHFLGYCDHIILYDDCSTDDTVRLALKTGGERIHILYGTAWYENRLAEETRHRALLLDTARTLGADWCLCFDADERLVGELPSPLTGHGYRFRLFDGYLTPGMQEPYRSGPLMELPRMWGPEYRDILMLFQTSFARYEGLDRREPFLLQEPAQADIKVMHYGKCLSVEHWEETCDYYATYFPPRYSKKWNARRGKAIHLTSDFQRTLWTWGALMRRPKGWVKL